MVCRLSIPSNKQIFQYLEHLLYARHCSRYFAFSSFFFFFFFRATPTTYGGSRLGVQQELQLLAYSTTTTTQDLSHVCDLHQSSRQRQILNPLSKDMRPHGCQSDSLTLSHVGNSCSRYFEYISKQIRQKPFPLHRT